MEQRHAVKQEKADEEEAFDDDDDKGHNKKNRRSWRQEQYFKVAVILSIVLGILCCIYYLFFSGTSTASASARSTSQPLGSAPTSKNKADPPKTQMRVAIIRPFIPLHTDEIIADLETWDEDKSFPCANPSSSPNDRPPVDLIFYFAYDLEDHPSGPKSKALLEGVVSASRWKNCFMDVKFLSAGLNSSTDNYLPTDPNIDRPSSGPVLTFHTINERPDIYKFYEYFMMMEPDVSPIRPNWLDQYLKECFGELHNFWMKGSMYVGAKFVDDDTSSPWLYHINGNSIYHVGDWQWRSFLKEVKKAMGVGNPYDVSIYEYRRTRFRRNQQVIHKFLYTQYIQNYGVAGYSLSQLKEERPDTYLVHKKRVCDVCDPILP